MIEQISIFDIYTLSNLNTPFSNLKQHLFRKFKWSSCIICSALFIFFILLRKTQHLQYCMDKDVISAIRHSRYLDSVHYWEHASDTLKYCFQFCFGRDYWSGGLQFGSECWCSGSCEKYGTFNSCKAPCTGHDVRCMYSGSGAYSV